MPLHKRESVREGLLDSVYADRDLLSTLPSKDFPTREMRPDEVFQAISDELLLDGNARQNLATFCQTWEEPEVHRLMDISIDKNLIDKDEYPQTAELERRCVQMLADLWNAPGTADAVGLLGHRIIGSLHAGRNGGQVALAGQATSPRASRSPRPTWCAARCRWCGTSSPGTGTSKCVRFRWHPAATPWTWSRCWSGSTRTPSWWCRPSG